jgi:hypothetical protein
MPSLFKSAVNTGIGTVPVDIVQIGAGVRATVIGMNVANTTDYDTINVNVFVISEDSVPAYYVKNIAIPPNTSVKIITQGEKLILAETAGIRIVSDTDNSVDSVVSYLEIS